MDCRCNANSTQASHKLFPIQVFRHFGVQGTGTRIIAVSTKCAKKQAFWN